jgi:hypothetical protein
MRDLALRTHRTCNPQKDAELLVPSRLLPLVDCGNFGQEHHHHHPNLHRGLAGIPGVKFTPGDLIGDRGWDHQWCAVRPRRCVGARR